MRLIKMLGLALVAAIVATALIGAGSASATLKATALCKAPELNCSATNTYPSGTTLFAHLVSGTKAVLSGGLTEECGLSLVKGKTTTGLGTTVLGNLTELTFTSCSKCKEVVALVSLAAPWQVHLKNLGELKGSMSVLGITVHLIDCTIFQIDCTATASEVSLDVSTNAKGLGLIKAVNEPLELGVCGKGTWNAEYELLEPDPIYVES